MQVCIRKMSVCFKIREHEVHDKTFTEKSTTRIEISQVNNSCITYSSFKCIQILANQHDSGSLISKSRFLFKELIHVIINRTLDIGSIHFII